MALFGDLFIGRLINMTGTGDGASMCDRPALLIREGITRVIRSIIINQDFVSTHYNVEVGTRSVRIEIHSF
jgi:hypothetical protein